MPPPAWDINFPHIQDAILDYVLDEPDDETIRALRAVSRNFSDNIDSRIVKHAVYVLDPPDVYTYIGRVRLPFGNGELEDRTRILDVRPGRCLYHGMSPSKKLPVHFRNQQYARVLNANCERILPNLICVNPGLTVIYAALQAAFRADKPVGNNSLGTVRTITVLPLSMGYTAIPTTPEPQTLLEAKTVFAFVQQTSADTHDEVIYHYNPWANIKKIGVQYCENDVRQCTLAGPSTTEWGFSDEVEVFDRMTVHYYDNKRRLDHGPQVRRISWWEWRQELSADEWELIASIPDHP
ncbi:hypothetical protein A1Q2_01371 [Trichosporon asahii var. asahii CBS 8904]|uniref:Uncharacterized protein n=1 Tax=Trichosporon asahii var. asahii (strain CBS 8904) TaxID=1220162 RepID=K1VJM6_TRIAC|nr:hypothetical protein A1Q2_01371 [Trichosporon asahii var. asahii CBS 8904]